MSRSRIVLSAAAFIALICAPAAAPDVSAAPKQASQKPASLSLPPPDYVYETGNKRDPFIPLITPDGRFVPLERTAEEEAASVLKVEGIIYDKYGLSYAIVDGSVVKVGDLISDYQVLTIEEKRVIFIREGQLKEVPLKKEE